MESEGGLKVKFVKCKSSKSTGGDSDVGTALFYNQASSDVSDMEETDENKKIYDDDDDENLDEKIDNNKIQRLNNFKVQSSYGIAQSSNTETDMADNDKIENISVDINKDSDRVKVRVEYSDDTQIIVAGNSKDGLDLDLDNKVSRLKSIMNKIKSMKEKEKVDHSGDDTDDYDFENPVTAPDADLTSTPPDDVKKKSQAKVDTVNAEQKTKKSRRKANPKRVQKRKKAKIDQDHAEEKNDEGESTDSLNKQSETKEKVKKPRSRGKPGKCEVCGKTFTRVTGLIEHMRIHTGETPFICEICGMTFNVRSNLQKHFRVHTGVKPYKCDFCGKDFAHSNVLNRHRKLHSGMKPFMCDVCGKQFYQRVTLLRHTLTHTGEKAFKCDVCNEGFNTKNTLIEHAKIHTGGVPFICPVCNREFFLRSHLYEHLRVHTGETVKNTTPPVVDYTDNAADNDNDMKCDVCDIEFTESSALLAHLRSHCYTGDDPYKCSVCEMLCISRKELQAHAKLHRQARTVTCDVCDKDFLSNSYLKIHKRIHTGERPFRCEVCGKSFVSNSDLTRHARIHTGEKPHRCEFCNRRFNRKSHLNTHFKVHAKAMGIKEPDVTLMNKKLSQMITANLSNLVSSDSHDDKDFEKSSNQESKTEASKKSHDLMSSHDQDNEIQDELISSEQNGGQVEFNEEVSYDERNVQHKVMTSNIYQGSSNQHEFSDQVSFNQDNVQNEESDNLPYQQQEAFAQDTVQNKGTGDGLRYQTDQTGSYVQELLQ